MIVDLCGRQSCLQAAFQAAVLDRRRISRASPFPCQTTRRRRNALLQVEQRSTGQAPTQRPRQECPAQRAPLRHECPRHVRSNGSLYYYPSYSLRTATILRRPPAAAPNRLVGQDGILRPIGNRPSDELARARERRVANPPQVANLPYIAPESFRSPWHSRPRVDLAERWPLTPCGFAALWGSQSWLQPAFSRLVRRLTNFSGFPSRYLHDITPKQRCDRQCSEPPERRLQARLPAPLRAVNGQSPDGGLESPPAGTIACHTKTRSCK